MPKYRVVFETNKLIDIRDIPNPSIDNDTHAP